MAPSMEYTNIENLNDGCAGDGLPKHDPEHDGVDVGHEAIIGSDDIPNFQTELFLRWGLSNESSGDTQTPEKNETVGSSGRREEDSSATDANTVSRVSNSEFPSKPSSSPSIISRPVSSVSTAHSRSGTQPTEAAPPRPSSMQIAEQVLPHGLYSFRNPSLQETGVFAREVSNDYPRSPIRSRPRKPLSGGSWFMEIFSFVIGLFALVAMVGVLARFDGKRMANWSTGITLNTLIAVLATIANAGIAFPLQQGLSQLKWIIFQREPRPLTDMEHFDDASRGAFGSAKLLVLGRGGILGSFGATMVILALAMGPTAQQIVGYRLRATLAVDDPPRAPASLKTATNYEIVLHGDNANPNSFVPILPMKAAVFNGMFLADPNPSVSFTCPTGTCTWPDFSTLAVCSSCVDMSQHMQQVCPATNDITSSNSTRCGWSLPNGASLNASSVFSMTTFIPSVDGDMPYSTIMKLSFMGTEAQNPNTTTPFRGSGGASPWATQCTLQYCVQDLHAYVVDGQLGQNITRSHFNYTVVPIREALNERIDTPLEIESPADNETYTVGMGALLGLQQYFSDLFRNGSATRPPTPALSRTENTIIVNLTVGVSSGETFFDTNIIQAFYWFYYEYPSGLAMVTSKLAAAMTDAFRESPGNGTKVVIGQSFEMASFVHIRWGWIALPAIVVAMTGVFLGLAMWRSRSTRTRLWKSSAIATLFYGLDGKTRAEAMRSGDLKQFRVKLGDEGLGMDGEGGKVEGGS